MELGNTVKGRGESWVVVQPQAGIASPQGDGNTAEEVSGGGGGELEEPTLLATARPMALVTATTSSASPPRASATRGIKSTPEARYAGRWVDSFRCTPTWRAWPGVKTPQRWLAAGGG